MIINVGILMMMRRLLYFSWQWLLFFPWKFPETDIISVFLFSLHTLLLTRWRELVTVSSLLFVWIWLIGGYTFQVTKLTENVFVAFCFRHWDYWYMFLTPAADFSVTWPPSLIPSSRQIVSFIVSIKCGKHKLFSLLSTQQTSEGSTDVLFLFYLAQ